MSQIAEQKCPACGAPLRFDPASGKLWYVIIVEL